MPCICNAYYEWADAMPRDTIARRGGGREREGEKGEEERWRGRERGGECVGDKVIGR